MESFGEAERVLRQISDSSQIAAPNCPALELNLFVPAGKGEGVLKIPNAVGRQKQKPARGRD